MPASAGALDDKVYQVCKKWRVDQGGWMPTEDMQHCRNVLRSKAIDQWNDDKCEYHSTGECVTSEAREQAKTELGAYN